VLRRAARRLASWRDEIVANYVAETGFTPGDGAIELDRTLQVFELSAQEAERLAGEVVPIAATPGNEDALCYTTRVPVGVVAAIAPFNAPLSTVAHKIAPALAAGNAVVLKPAELTPLGSLALVRALLEAGLPPRRMQLLPGPGETVGDQMVRHPAVGYISFTGSTAIGWHIRAVSGLARTQLELGSNSPTLLWRDADLDLALPMIVQAGYRKAGQVCTSVQRLLVHRDIAADVSERLTGLVRALRYGDPRSPGAAFGPLISEAAAARAEWMIADAVSAGARLAAGGTRSGPVLAPTLLDDLPPEALLAQDEAFAPVIAMTTIGSVAEGVALANATRYGLQAGVFCQDLDVAFTFARRLRMGGVIVNGTSSYHPDPMPYGGVKDSGQGTSGPRYAVADMTDTRTIVLRLRPAG
jgi:succinate-semialdehyde dehydrogenase/glutarate-semialdehyde dehydrogenase